MRRILDHIGLSATAEDFVAIRGLPDDLWPADGDPGEVENNDGIDIPFFDDEPAEAEAA